MPGEAPSDTGGSGSEDESASVDDDSGASEDEASSEGDASSEDESSGEGESSSEAESDDMPEPLLDLPEEPEPNCLDFDGYFAGQWCFQPPLSIDPDPVDHIEIVRLIMPGVHERYYVAGPAGHRLYEPEQLVPGGSFEDLPFTGTVVARAQWWLGQPSESVEVLVTRDPNQIYFVRFTDPVTIVAQLELDYEPTAADWYVESDWETDPLAVTDVDGQIHFYDEIMGEPTLTGTRALPERFDRLVRPMGWSEEYLGSPLLGLARASSTVYLLENSIAEDGPITPWDFPSEIVAWRVTPFSDVGYARILAFSDNPSSFSYYGGFGLGAPQFSHVVEHTPIDTDWGHVDWAFAELFVLSDDAHIANIARSSGKSSSFHEPGSWVEAPEGTVDFVSMNQEGFACASTIHGLMRLQPE